MAFFKVAVLTLTNHCNLSCGFCFGKENRSEMSAEEIIELFKKLKEKGVSRVVISGGEPLLRPDLEKIASSLHQLGFKLSLHTNGILLDPFDPLLRYFDTINLPIDGTEEVHYKMGRAGFEETISKIISLAKMGKKTTISTVATKLNLHSIPTLKELLETLPIYEWRIFRFNPKRGVALENKEKYFLKKSEFETLKAMHSDKIKIRLVDFDDDFEKSYILVSSDGTITEPK